MGPGSWVLGLGMGRMGRGRPGSWVLGRGRGRPGSWAGVVGQRAGSTWEWAGWVVGRGVRRAGRPVEWDRKRAEWLVAGNKNGPKSKLLTWAVG